MRKRNRPKLRSTLSAVADLLKGGKKLAAAIWTVLCYHVQCHIRSDSRSSFQPGRDAGSDNPARRTAVCVHSTCHSACHSPNHFLCPCERRSVLRSARSSLTTENTWECPLGRYAGITRSHFLGPAGTCRCLKKVLGREHPPVSGTSFKRRI